MNPLNAFFNILYYLIDASHNQHLLGPERYGISSIAATIDVNYLSFEGDGIRTCEKQVTREMGYANPCISWIIFGRLTPVIINDLTLFFEDIDDLQLPNSNRTP